MRCFLLAVLLSNFLSVHSQAPEKRALIIAIDKYTPPESADNANARLTFRDLDGCVNDGRSIESIAVSRFQFSANQIDTLYNESASRDGMLKAMNNLLDKSQPGDIAFIYYAGHGSQVPNTLSKETDKKDESMVPSDTWKEGVGDIRDKELATIYNKFVDKGVKLTVIMDCCHSGSISRGSGETNPSKFRYMPDANYDAKDGSEPIPPETRKEGTFLIMSAAQDNEFAQEQRDENNMPHGAFTIAFIQALEQQSADASVLNLFVSIRAILKSNGKKQEPVLGGSPERQEQTLFGLEKGTIPDKTLVAVAGFNKGKIILQGGFALGLYKDNELIKIKDSDTLVKLRVDTVIGVSKSEASIIKGDVSKLKAGEFLEVSNWVSSAAPLLKLYIPASTMKYEQVEKLAKVNKELMASTKIRWINDLRKDDPYMGVFFDQDKCNVNVDGKLIKDVKDVSAASILQLCKPDSTLYVELPPSIELITAIKEKFRANSNIKMMAAPNEAHYVLFGTINELGQPSYGFRRAQISSRDSLESMPLQTKSFDIQNNSKDAYASVANNLFEYALRLSKIRGWLNLSTPRSGGKSFPFHIELVNKDDGQTVGANGSRIGDNISLQFVADKNYKSIRDILMKYVYVFAIDQFGKMTLGYPDERDGNVSNKFPHMTDTLINEREELFTYEVSEPVGTDNIFLLATEDPITNYALLFNQDGVKAIDTRGAGNNPLADLLNLGNEGSRSGFDKKSVPSNWILYRLPVKSRH